jgi:Tol biopolymer transport system component
MINNVLKIILMVMIVLLFSGCLEVEQEDQDLISFRVISSSVEGHISRIALANYQKGRFIKYITSAEDEAVKSHFSPDKKKLIIEFKSSSSANQLGIYDIESDSLTKIYQYYPGIEFPLFGKDPIWNSDGNGFYFTISNRNIYYYDIETNDYRAIYSDYGTSAYCIGLKSED